MTKTPPQDKTSSSQEDSLKKRKKLAKKEARLLLKVEQAKRDIQKAEQRIQEAQNNLKIQNDQLQELENNLSELQTPTHSVADKKATNKKSSRKTKKKDQDPVTSKGNKISSEETQESSVAIDELHQASPEPAEGRADIGEAPTTSTTDTNNPTSYS